MTDEAPDLQLPPIQDDLEYASDAQIVVRRVTMPDGVADSIVGGIFVDWIDVGVPSAHARQHLLAVVWDFEQEVAQPYVLFERRTEYEWGSSSVALSWIIEVIETVGTEALTAGLIYAVHKIKGNLAPTPAEPLTRETAQGKARQAVARVFDLSADELTVHGEEIDSAGPITVILTSSSGDSFTVRVAPLGRLYLASHVTRTTRSPTP